MGGGGRWAGRGRVCLMAKRGRDAYTAVVQRNLDVAGSNPAGCLEEVK